MILPMKKYSFLIYHQEHSAFLTRIQELGILHLIETTEPDDKLKTYHTQVAQLEAVLKSLKKRFKLLKPDATIPTAPADSLDGQAVFEQVKKLQAENEQLAQQLSALNKDIKSWQPWGEFTEQDREKLKQAGFNLRFYQLNQDKITADFHARYAFETVSTAGKTAYLAVFSLEGENNFPDFEDVKLPEISLSALQADLAVKTKRSEEISQLLDGYAVHGISALEQARNTLTDLSELERAALNSVSAAENRVRVLQGWLPEEKESALQQYLDESGIVYLAEKPEPEEFAKVPVLLKNNSFSKLYEPIGKLFSLPSYAELDLTPLFAPFFMLFFGLCLGDSGYGLAMVIGATIAKFKMDPKIRPMLTLVQLLGASTIFGGALSGTFFGIELAKANYLSEEIRSLFLPSQTMFYLAIAIGFVQVIFGQIVKCFNISKQNSFTASLSTIGWIIMELSAVLIAIPELKTAGTITVYLGLSMALLFSTSGNIFKRIGLGLWDMYNNITGVFGDLLSYIRLFALGISGSILGMVINNIGGIFQDIPYVGWLIWIIFLIVGHTGNLLLCSLGSFVHPMRLTFVEFYKNSGWTGGGKDYKPFSKKC